MIIRIMLLALMLTAFISSLCTPLANAEDGLFVAHEVQLSFQPEATYLFYERRDGGIRRVVGNAVQLQVSDAAPISERRWLLIGAISGQDVDVSSLNIGYVVAGSGLHVHVVPLHQVNNSLSSLLPGSITALRERILASQRELEKFRRDLDIQRESLSRLRRDAAEIANVAKVDELRAEARAARQAIEGVARDIARLTSAVQAVKALPLPKGYARREVELTEQLRKLTDAATEAERGERERLVKSERTLQEQIEIVNQAREQDPEELRQLLADLRGEREALEATVSNQAM